MQLATCIGISTILLEFATNGVQVKDPASFTKSWLASHMMNAGGKPFVVEEFGKSVDLRDPGTIAQVRDPVFTAVHDALSDSLKSDGNFRGVIQ